MAGVDGAAPSTAALAGRPQQAGGVHPSRAAAVPGASLRFAVENGQQQQQQQQQQQAPHLPPPPSVRRVSTGGIQQATGSASSVSSAALAMAARSAKDARRNSLNMEKMIKKNVLAAPRPGGGKKRGMAVVEFFKQQQQQQQQQHGDHATRRDSAAIDGTESAMAVTSDGLEHASKRRREMPPSPSPAATPSQLPPQHTAPPTSASSSSSSAAAAAAARLVSPTPSVSSGARAVSASKASLALQAASSPALATRASPARLPPQVPSPSRKRVARPVPELAANSTTDSTVTTTTAAASSSASAKTPFLSFQNKLEQQARQTGQAPLTPTRGGGGSTAFAAFSPVRSTRSPARRMPTPSPVRSYVRSPARSSTQSPGKSPARSPASVRRTREASRTPVRTAASSIVDLTDLEDKRTTSGQVGRAVTTPGKQPSARSLFANNSSATTTVAATKSLCFSTEGVASSMDVTPDGECIVVAFTDGSVRMYEMDSTVPSDRHGYLLGHLDEESHQNSAAGAHLRVKVSNDGRYAFVGCRFGPRVMMSINLHHYRNGKDTEDDDMDQLQKSFHANTRLRGFSDATKCPLGSHSTHPDGEHLNAYYLLCGLGVGTLNMWQFVEPRRQQDAPNWNFLFSIPTNGNTAVIASFLPPTGGDAGNDSPMLRLAARCEDKLVRVWNLKIQSTIEDSKEEEGDQTTDATEPTQPTHHTVQGYYDLPATKDVVAFYGRFAYGIAPSGEAYQLAIPENNTDDPTSGGARARPLPAAALERTHFEVERIEMGGSTKSRRSTVILESIYASGDGFAIVAVSTDGVFYYCNMDGGKTSTGEEDTKNQHLLRILGRNASRNTQFKSPMIVYKPETVKPTVSVESASTATDVTALPAVMAVITNPQSEDGDEDEYGESLGIAEGYINVDPTETWAARWMVPSTARNCWVCGVRNICHWQNAPASERSAHESRSVVSTSSKQGGATSARVPSSSSSKQSRANFLSPATSNAAESPSCVPSSASSSSSSSSSNKKEDGKPKASTKSKKAVRKPLKLPTLHGAQTNERYSRMDSDSMDASPDQLKQELARYKERYNQIVTEWQRRLKGERQMRRLWKQRETEFESQLRESTIACDAAHGEALALREAHRDSEKKFIFEKLRAEQQSSVKIQYDQLCEQMQERMAALEHQQRVMEQTTRSLLQEVDRQVQHSKQSVNGLVDPAPSQQESSEHNKHNECILCKDKRAVTAVVPCGHLCFCEEDADNYRLNFRGGDQVVCPICQREMISMLRIY